jgi:hypothetical protein
VRASVSTWALNHATVCFTPSAKGVNLNSGTRDISLALLAVFLNCVYVCVCVCVKENVKKNV